MPDNKFVRFRFSVPKADQDVLAWAEEQANLSISLRTLIRDSIRTHGIVDATCLPVVVTAATDNAATRTRARTAAPKPETPREPENAAPADATAQPARTEPSAVPAPAAPEPAPQPAPREPAPAPTPETPPPPAQTAPNPGTTDKQAQLLSDMLMT